MPGLQRKAPEAAQLVEALLDAGNALSTITARSLTRVRDDVSPAQFRALAELAKEPSGRVVDLADALGVNRSTATRMSDRLADKQLVTRRRQRSDRRTVRLTLTDAGRDLLKDVGRHRRADVTEIVGRLSDSDQRSFTTALRAFVEASELR